MDIKVDEKTVIVFDLDDTLYNELDYLISAYKSIADFLDKENRNVLFSKMLLLYRSGEDVFGFLQENYKIKKSKLLLLYRTHKPKLKIDPKIQSLLESIKQNKGHLALLTDGRSFTQRNKIDALGITTFFDYISISEEIEAEKPSLKGFKLIENNFKKEKYFYIGDNLNKDFIAPNKLKWTTICLIDNGKNIHYKLLDTANKEREPNYYICSLTDIVIV